MIPLTFAAVGEKNIIRKAGGKADVKKHLEDLGFIAAGNVIVNIKESRIAIGKEMASKIMI